MTRFGLVQDFIAKTKAVARITHLHADTEAAARDLGFRYFAILHHVDIRRGVEGLVRCNNYPEGFLERARQNRYYLDDPVLMAAQQTSRGFLWSEVPGILTLSSRQKQIISLGAGEGIGDGYTVPLHVPGEFAASCSFGVGIGDPMPEENLPYLHYLGAFAFEAAWRIARKQVRSGPTPLTGRQLDCLVLAARGHSARAIACALGIREGTVEKHLEDARLRAGVKTTTQLVVRSLFDGALSYSDVMVEEIAAPPRISQ